MLGQAQATAGKHLLKTAPHAQAQETADWEIPVLRTTATSGEGIPELAAAIRRHRTHLKQSGDWQQRDQVRLQSELDSLLQTTLLNRWRDTVSWERYQQTLDLLANRSISPLQAVEKLLNKEQSQVRL